MPSPRTVSSPLVGRTVPLHRRKNVVFPLPLGPSTATIWPPSMVSETSRNASTPLGYRFARFMAWMTDMSPLLEKAEPLALGSNLVVVVLGDLRVAVRAHELQHTRVVELQEGVGDAVDQALVQLGAHDPGIPLNQMLFQNADIRSIVCTG